MAAKLSRFSAMLRVEQRYWPSSSKVALRAAGEQSWKRSECSTARTAWRSSAHKARAGVGRGMNSTGNCGRGGRPEQWPLAVVGRAGHAEGGTGRLDAYGGRQVADGIH